MGAGDKNKENVTPEVKEEAGGPKKHMHELPPAPKQKHAKYTRKMADHDMTKKVLASFLTNDEDEIEITLSGFAKHIKKICPEAQEDCLMELGEVVNRYIWASRMKKSIPSATVSAPVVSNDNIMQVQPNMDCKYSSMPPSTVKNGGR